VPIDDATVRTPQLAALLSDVPFWRGLGHKYQMVDKQNEKAAVFKAQIDKAGGLPCLVVMDADVPGKVLGTYPVKSDTPANMRKFVTDTIAKLTGK